MYEKLAKAKGFSIFMAIVCYLGAKVTVMCIEGFHSTSILIPAVLRAPMLLFSCVDWDNSGFLYIGSATASFAVLAVMLIVVAIVLAIIAYILHTLENEH